MKVLCLHGYTQTGPLFARKCQALSAGLARIGCETIFASAPYSATNVDPKYGIKDQPEMLTWWTLEKTSPEYLRIDKALDTLRNTISAHGPFEGILGFSQGAGFAGAICNRFPDLFSQPELRFAIFVGGFILQAEFYQGMYSKTIDMPTCHVLGEYDTIVSEERSKALIDKCTQATIVRHPGNHYVPTREPYVSEIVKFVETASAGPAAQL